MADNPGAGSAISMEEIQGSTAPRPGSSARLPNPVVVIPGVLGSKLVADADSASVWGEWRPGFRDPATGDGARLFGLPMDGETPLERLISGSRVDGALADVHGSIAGVPIKITAYGSIMSAMGVESYADTFAADRSSSLRAGEAAFEYSYDWRQSLDVSAIEFGAFLNRATRFLQVQRGSSDPIRFDVVAHSMGGLLLRYFLLYGRQLLAYDDTGPRLNWAGAAHIEKALIIGTPNAGSLRMIERLVQGIPGNPVHPTYGPVLIGTMPAGYQMLPRARHAPCADGPVDLLDPEFWLARDWGVCATWLEEERAVQMPEIATAWRRREIAEQHLRKCLRNARYFQQAMDRPIAALPPGVEFHLFLGSSIRTPAQFTFRPADRRVRWARQDAGDGTVLASSARLEEAGGGSPIPWASVRVLKSSHMGLLRDPVLVQRLLQLHSSAAQPD